MGVEVGNDGIGQTFGGGYAVFVVFKLDNRDTRMIIRKGCPHYMNGDVKQFRKPGSGESGMAEKYRPLVGILAPVEERVRRIMARDGIDEDYARHRIASQKSDDFYREHCDFILVNDSTQEVFANKSKKYFMEVIREHERI